MIQQTSEHKETNISKIKTFIKSIPYDYLALFSNLLLYVLFSGAIQGIGALRGWNSPTFTDNDPRFIPKPKMIGAYYFWQLRPEQVTFWSIFSYWTLFGIHQLFVWSVMYMAQLYKKPYTNNLNWFNFSLLIGNFLFHCLHLAQTHFFYDGLAKDTPESTSQSAVIMMLVLIIAMEYKDRGILFGWPSNKPNKVTWYLRLGDVYMKLIRKYHGYAFSWAAIYTFWYHPMESTVGHVMGFMYTSMMMLQGSLIFTNAHKNRVWTTTIEVFVIVHSGVVAVQTRGNAIWPMFVFGFAMVFFFNQIYAFEFWENINYAYRLLPPIFYLVPTACAYLFLPDSQGRILIRMNEIIRIPFILIGFAVFTLGFMFVLSVAYHFLHKLDKDLFSRSYFYRYSKRFICLSIALGIYVVLIMTGVIMHSLKWDEYIDLTTLMIALVFYYIIGVCLSFVFMGMSVGTPVTVHFPFPRQISKDSTSVEKKLNEVVGIASVESKSTEDKIKQLPSSQNIAKVDSPQVEGENEQKEGIQQSNEEANQEIVQDVVTV
jgi:hypothetical protein